MTWYVRSPDTHNQSFCWWWWGVCVRTCIELTHSQADHFGLKSHLHCLHLHMPLFSLNRGFLGEMCVSLLRSPHPTPPDVTLTLMECSFLDGSRCVFKQNLAEILNSVFSSDSLIRQTQAGNTVRLVEGLLSVHKVLSSIPTMP